MLPKSLLSHFSAVRYLYSCVFNVVTIRFRIGRSSSTIRIDVYSFSVTSLNGNVKTKIQP